jgi:hypothetical protein
MAFQPFACEPPTPSSLAHARRFLDETTTSRADLDRKIEAAEAQLAQIIADSRCAIEQLQREREALDEKISRARAYMSPIRRLPSELLRHIFMMNFDEYPCCAWILSSVCLQWRRLALSMPKLWSKVWHPLPSLLSFQVFFVGAFVGLAWPSPRTFPAHFPTEPALFYRVIALPVCQRSFPGLTVICFLNKKIRWPNWRLCAPHFVHLPSKSWPIWPSIAGAETVSWYPVDWALDTVVLPVSLGLLSRCSNCTPTNTRRACFSRVDSHSPGSPSGELPSYLYLMFAAWISSDALPADSPSLTYAVL